MATILSLPELKERGWRTGTGEGVGEGRSVQEGGKERGGGGEVCWLISKGDLKS